MKYDVAKIVIIFQLFFPSYVSLVRIISFIYFFCNENLVIFENPKIILTDVLEIYIIELSKGEELLKNMSKKEQSKNSFNTWLQFINNPEAIVDMENKEINKAKKVLEEISQDEREQRLTELREKYIMDQKAVEEAGFDKGLAVGIQQGIKQNQIEIAKKLLNKGTKLEEIIELTDLTKDEIISLKDK